jgi:ArsR family transcriptional regulator
MDIVIIFKALADETRIRILNLLRKDTLCVCDIEEVLKISQSNASRHLAKLKIAKIITGEKKAQWVYYQIDANILAKHAFVNELLTRELDEHPQCQKDLERLKRYRECGGSCETTVKIADD